MDGDRFDLLTTRLATAVSRRRGLGLLAALGVGGDLLTDSAAARKRKKQKKKKSRCNPNCTDRACGDDGCGGSCGECSVKQTCNANGRCVCRFQTCAGACCNADEACREGVCASCTPNCDGKACGSDGCGSVCLPGCDGNHACDEHGACQCATLNCQGECCGASQICHLSTNECCAPQSGNEACAGKACGAATNNCGQSVACGSCAQGEQCDEDGHCICVPDCHDKLCGGDGCDGSCGECDTDQRCQQGVCVNRDCDVCETGCAFSSVQAAITAAAPGATVTVCPGSYPSVLTINKNLRLVGAGSGTTAGDTKLQGDGTQPVVKIARGVTVTLKKLRITGGRGNQGDGGGIENQGTTTIIACAITGNTSGNSGGGISNYVGSVTLTDSSVFGNSAENWGGGVANREGTLTATNSALTGNTASGATSNPGGGAIYNNRGTAELTGCTLNGNRALIAGGGIYNVLGNVTLTVCAVNANSITFEGTGQNTNSRGGGIASDGGTLTLTGCTVNDNFAHQGGGFMLEGDPYATLKLTDCEISRNTASRLSGGGIRSAGSSVDLVNTRISENKACCDNEDASGGGISVSFGSVKFDKDSKVIQNSAKRWGGGVCSFRSAVTPFDMGNIVGNTPENCKKTPQSPCEVVSQCQDD